MERYNITSNGVLTPNGEEILFDCLPVEEIPETIDNDEFEEFWKAFPRDDAYRHWPRTRALRWNKKETREQYSLARKKRTHEELMRALTNEISIHQASEETNGFRYMKGSINWLAKESYEDYLDIELPKSSDYGKEVI